MELRKRRDKTIDMPRETRAPRSNPPIHGTNFAVNFSLCFIVWETFMEIAQRCNRDRGDG